MHPISSCLDTGNTVDTALRIWTYWEGPKYPLIDLCLESIRRHHPDIRILSQLDVLDRIGSEPIVLTEGQPLHYRSNLIRFLLMKKFGGRWIDADVLAFRPTRLTDGVEADMYLYGKGHIQRPVIGSGHFAIRKGDLADIAYDLCKNAWLSRKPDSPYGVCGNKIVVALYRKYSNRFNIVLRPSGFLNPIPDIVSTKIMQPGTDKEFNSQKDWDWNSLCIFHLDQKMRKVLHSMSAAEILQSQTFIGHLVRRSLGLLNTDRGAE